jgi:hypothetical protein
MYVGWDAFCCLVINQLTGNIQSAISYRYLLSYSFHLPLSTFHFPLYEYEYEYEYILINTSTSTRPIGGCSMLLLEIFNSQWRRERKDELSRWRACWWQ